MKILKGGEYYGQKKKALEINGILLSEYSYDTPKTDWHYHENPYFMYLLQGQLYDVNKQSKKRCDSGALIFHNWQEKHYNYKHSKLAKGFHIEFKQGCLGNLGFEELISEGSIMVRNPNAHLLLGKLYYEFHFKDTFSNIGIESLLIALCSNIEKNEKVLNAKPAWLKTLTDLVHENSEPQTLNSLSATLGVHQVHISRTFSKQFGYTLSEYIRMIKLKKSIPYVLENKYNLTEISYLCGFSDQSHFSRTFRQYIGTSPSKYRARFNMKC